jgi:hypothetical protein
MPQPPDVPTVAQVLDRARIIHGDELAESLAEGLADDWRAAADRGAEQAVWAAAWQLTRAARWRAAGGAGVANMLDHLAEACIRGWADEVAVRTATVEDAPGIGR